MSSIFANEHPLFVSAHTEPLRDTSQLEKLPNASKGLAGSVIGSEHSRNRSWHSKAYSLIKELNFIARHHAHHSRSRYNHMKGSDHPFQGDPSGLRR